MRTITRALLLLCFLLALTQAGWWENLKNAPSCFKSCLTDDTPSVGHFIAETSDQVMESIKGVKDHVKDKSKELLVTLEETAEQAQDFAEKKFHQTVDAVKDVGESIQDFGPRLAGLTKEHDPLIERLYESVKQRLEADYHTLCQPTRPTLASQEKYSPTIQTMVDYIYQSPLNLRGQAH